MLKLLLRCAILGLACGALALVPDAKAIPIGAGGYVQLVIDAGGSFTASGQLTSPPLSIPFQTKSLSFSGGPLTISATPFGYIVEEVSSSTLTGITDVSLDLFTGQKAILAFDLLILDSSFLGIPLALPLSVSGEFKGLAFQQTGPATIVPTGLNTGSFIVPGDYHALLHLTASEGLSLDFGTSNLVSPGVLSAAYTFQIGEDFVLFDATGHSDVSFPVAATFALSSMSMPAGSATFNVNGAIDVSMDHHLFWLFIPEPSSITLIVIAALTASFHLLAQKARARLTRR
jgi:hypothetical protein